MPFRVSSGREPPAAAMPGTRSSLNQVACDNPLRPSSRIRKSSVVRPGTGLRCEIGNRGVDRHQADGKHEPGNPAWTAPDETKHVSERDKRPGPEWTRFARLYPGGEHRRNTVVCRAF